MDQILTWFSRPEISGTPALAAQNARLVLDSGVPLTQAVLLNLGHALVRAHALTAAVEIYGRAHMGSNDARYHFGQALLDYLHACRISQDDLRSIAGLLGLGVDAVVPDLARQMLVSLEPGPDDDRLIAGLAAAAGPQRARQVGSAALAAGHHATANAIFSGASQSQPTALEPRLMLGVAQLLSGNVGDAERSFAVLEAGRRLEQSRWGVADARLTVMHDSWLASVGRLASLGTYVRAMELGWAPKQRSVIAFDTRDPPQGWPLLAHFGRHLEVLGGPTDPAETIDRHLWGADARSHPDPDARRTSLTDFFWYGPDAQGRARWYAPWAAEVERASQPQLRPLLAIGAQERVHFRSLMAQVFSLPEDAWYVVLDTREADLRGGSSGETASGADASAFEAAIDLVIQRGGWVVVMGDPWMQPLRPRPGLVDYATSGLRTPALDIELYAECRFFLGGHSGYSLIPPLFGRRCLLANWSRTTLPSWHPGDVVLPIVPRSGALAELADRSEATEMVANTPEEIAGAAAELLAEIESGAPPVSDPLQARFHQAMDALCGYHGARTSPAFLSAHPGLV